MSAALLDVNVLVALFDPLHPNHGESHAWFAAHSRRPWATCPITINGCIRVLSNPRYPSFSAAPGAVAEHLRILCARPSHEFWADDLSPLDDTRLLAGKITGFQQITDVYLLALAVAHGGRLVTFDRSISRRAVPHAKETDLQILGR